MAGKGGCCQHDDVEAKDEPDGGKKTGERGAHDVEDDRAQRYHEDQATHPRHCWPPPTGEDANYTQPVDDEPRGMGEFVGGADRAG